MILTVDIGNTTVGMCIIDENGEYDLKIRAFAKTDTALEKGAADYEMKISSFLRSVNIFPKDIEGAAISSVVPSLNQTIYKIISSVTGREPFLITPNSKSGLIFAVSEPDKIGTDRIVDSSWAAFRYGKPVVTVDMGTATTFNVVNEDGVFLGGVITAGMGTSISALSSRTACLPDIKISSPEYLIGKNTEECMLSGAVIGSAAMIDDMTLRIERELGKPVTLVITGGMSHYVIPFCNHKYIYDPYLLMKGIAYIYKKNKK